MRLLKVWCRALADATEPLSLHDSGVTTSLVYWSDLMYAHPPESSMAFEGVLENSAAAIDGGGDAELPVPNSPEEAEFIRALRARLTTLSDAQMQAAPLTTQDAAGSLERVPLPWFIKQPVMKVLVLTNFHVVNEHGTAAGIRPAETEVVLEAADANRVYPVAQLLWSSPVERCDASLLRLAQPIVGVEPIPLAAALPIVDTSTRVYVVGHPGGRDLSFSFQDNELLDHEGPPLGKPQLTGVCRVHYRAPTEGGSSGSPVFNADSWQVIALHHKGGKRGIPRLNGLEGTYAANEGIALASIRAWIGR